MAQDSTQNTEKLVLVGEITAPFGVSGQVKMRPFLSSPQILARLPQVQVVWPDKREESHRIRSARLQKPDMAVVSVEGVDDREGADRLRGTRLFIRAEELPPLPEGEYYDWQLVGLRVETQSGRDLGTIQRVHFLPANDVYETEDAMIPAVEEIVLSVDVGGGRMIVADIPGLRKDE